MNQKSTGATPADTHGAGPSEEHRMAGATAQAATAETKAARKAEKAAEKARQQAARESRTFRRHDAGREFTWTQGKWTSEQVADFYSWVIQKATDLEVDIIKAQREQDLLAFEIAGYHAAGQSEPTYGSWQEVWDEYQRNALRLEFDRHVQRLLRPLYERATLHDGLYGGPAASATARQAGGFDLPRRDWIIGEFYELHLKEDFKGRRADDPKWSRRGD